jgi:hypothetical protein
MRESGVTEFIEHEREGLLADDDRDLARQIVRLCVDPALRDAIARHNQRFPVALTWERSIALHLALYRRAGELLRD